MLKRKAGMLLDLVNANFAEETLDSVRGGPKSRPKQIVFQNRFHNFLLKPALSKTMPESVHPSLVWYWEAGGTSYFPPPVDTPMIGSDSVAPMVLEWLVTQDLYR